MSPEMQCPSQCKFLRVRLCNSLTIEVYLKLKTSKNKSLLKDNNKRLEKSDAPLWSEFSVVLTYE